MATPTRRFVTTTTGQGNLKPIAVLATSKIDTIIGSIIQLDGRQSYDPERQSLTFKWSFTQVPLGSGVEDIGFKDIRPNSTAVSFIPDKTGIYVVQLVVNDGELNSAPVTCYVNIQLTRVPVGENIVPDAQFLWNYISDFWKLVEDREKITTLWSSVIQLIGAELIKLWGNDYNKSFNTIQSSYQRRWQKFSMVTDLSSLADQRIIVGKTDSGVGGASGNIGAIPGIGNTSVFYLPLGRVGDGDKTDFTSLKGNYGPKGRVLVVDDTTYTIDRVVNQDQSITTGTDLVTTLASNTVTSASGFGDAVEGDILVIKAGSDAGRYRIKIPNSSTSITVVYPADPPAGPIPSFHNGSSIGYSIVREYSLAVVNEMAIPDGLVNASWRVPHLLHTPNLDLEAQGIRAGDILVFGVNRADLGLSTEVQAQVVGANGDRLGFELTVQELDPSVNEGSDASLVESGGIVTVSGLTNIRETSAGGYLEILNGDNPGVYKIRSYISEDAVIIDNSLASGADSGNPGIQWVERAKTGVNVERALFQKIVRDLRIVPASSSDTEVAAAAEALIRFMPIGINLSTRPFSKYGITFKAKKVHHNTAIKVPNELVSVPVLQESVVDPPVALRENLDYLVESGYLTFVNELFSLSSPSPEVLWAECTLFDNSAVVEQNFGRLVGLSRDDLSSKNTRAPYLSAVKGLFFAYTNGPTVANIRLGLQILFGLPFAEEKGVILEVQDDFTVDTSGNPLGRMLVEDLDDAGKKTGNRRIYLYSNLVGLETNPSTLEVYKAGDTINRFAPISKGVDVLDYVKDPLWWKRSLYGLEILKYFTFKVIVDGQIFDSNDVQFALDFVKIIKPAYTQVITSALLEFSDDIITSDSLGGRILLKFYTSPWGLEATNRANDMNSQGAVLWTTGAYPFHTRTPRLLKDVVTQKFPEVSGSNANISAPVSGICQLSGILGLTSICVGDQLTILSGPNVGTYTITSFTNPNLISFATPAGWADVNVNWKVTAAVLATSATGWDTSMIRGRTRDTATYSGFEDGKLPPIEGDVLVILAGQPGAAEAAPGMYEIEQVIDAHTLRLGWVASTVDPDQYATAGTVKNALDASIFPYGSSLKCSILRRENPTVLWGKDLVTDGTTNKVTSATANFLKNHVRVGDHLCVESGANKGEYIIDSLENSGSVASIAASVSGLATVTGLTSMILQSEGGILQVLNGANKGTYFISQYVSATSVKIRTATAVLQTSVQWREVPRAPYISATQVGLKNDFGAPSVLSALAGQSFRVTRPFMHKAEVYNVQVAYSNITTEMVLQGTYASAAGIGASGDCRDLFTPGMVGLTVNISESSVVAHDGAWMITRYINSGRVMANVGGTTDDTGTDKLNFLGAP